MYNSFEFLKKIYFVRTGGSPEELKAAELIKEEVEKYDNVTCEIQPFEVDGFTINKQVLKFIDPDIEVPFKAVGVSGSTIEGGLDGEFVYVNSEEYASMYDLEGKVVLVDKKLLRKKFYKILVEKKVAAIIYCTGDVYKEAENVDLDPYRNDPDNYEMGKIPSFCIRMRDADAILKAMPKKVHFELQQDEFKVDSRNVVAEIKGTKHPEEIVVFSAHFDSVSYSKGAYDNGTGSTTILEMVGYFSEHLPDRTVRFVWCGSEEDGLFGSKAYVEKYKDELDKHLFDINVDMTGVTLGRDTAVVTAESGLVDYIKYMSKEVGFPISVRQGVASSDSTPFADKGVPSMSFARFAPRGGATIHSHDDVIDWLSEDNYYKTCEFIEMFASRLINAYQFPVGRVIPEKIKEEIDIYNQRKEKKE